MYVYIAFLILHKGFTLYVSFFIPITMSLLTLCQELSYKLYFKKCANKIHHTSKLMGPKIYVSQWTSIELEWPLITEAVGLRVVFYTSTIQYIFMYLFTTQTESVQ